MIQEIFPHRFANQYLPNKEIEDNDYVLHYNENSLLLKCIDEHFEIPRKSDLSDISANTRTIFLFTLNDIPCFLLFDKPKIETAQLVYTEISSFRTIKQREIAWVSIIGFQLKCWYDSNCYCCKCGSGTRPKTDERAIVCPQCGTMVFPKISPAVIMAVVCKDRILLARGSNFTGSWFSLLAGYVDAGETLEETVIREVKEEVGLDVKNIRYYKSQPWPPSSSMMIGFVAEADDTQPIIIDDKEIVEAAWFTRGKLPQHSSTISIAGEMIEQFEEGKI